MLSAPEAEHADGGFSRRLFAACCNPGHEAAAHYYGSEPGAIVLPTLRGSVPHVKISLLHSLDYINQTFKANLKVKAILTKYSQLT